jgi:Domain of Unknown Function (DUF1206)
VPHSQTRGYFIASPYGVFLLIVVALGLAADGVFCFFDARYHRV